MAQQRFRIIEHTADTGFEVRGTSKAKVFEAAALAFFSIMWNIGLQTAPEPETIEVEGGDMKELMVNFLEEFLYLYDAKKIVCTELVVDTIAENKIRARAWMQNFDDDKDQELLGVKAVTYHQLYIGKRGGEWLARVFLDI